MLPQANKMTLKSLYADLPKIPNFFVKKIPKSIHHQFNLIRQKHQIKVEFLNYFPIVNNVINTPNPF